MNTPIQTLLVLGTGTMGSGIAQVAAASGGTVLLYDLNPGAAAKACQRIAESLERAEAKGYVTKEVRERTLSGLHPVDSLDDLARVDAVIEAVREDLAVKQAVFQDLENRVGPETLLWTNTSMISITEIAQPLKNPERLCGVHFFNPVPRMELVEIIAGETTAETTIQRAEATVAHWGKTPVRAPDRPGFIVNRLLDALLREALTLHGEGVSHDAIDTAVRLGLNFPMGPMELMDLIGLDTVQDCLKSQAFGMNRAAGLGDTLPRLVAEGQLGKKSGSGFYRHDS